MTHITARFGATPRQPTAKDTLAAHDEDRLAALMAEDARRGAERVAQRDSSGWTVATTQAQANAAHSAAHARKRRWVQLGHTYDRIAAELRARGEGTVNELSEAVGRSHSAMRLRLKEMEAEGRVAHSWRVVGNGRVAKVYRLTEGQR